jgi:hypothetical protein
MVAPVRLSSKTDLRLFSAILGFVLLLSTIPLTSGLVIVLGSSQPEITINICQPAQIFSHTSNTILARPSVKVPQLILVFRGSLKKNPSAEVVEHSVPPDTPPPERLV